MVSREECEEITLFCIISLSICIFGNTIVLVFLVKPLLIFLPSIGERRHDWQEGIVSSKPTIYWPENTSIVCHGSEKG